MLSITRFLRGCVFLFFFIAIPSLVSAKSDFDSLSVRSAEEFVFAHTESEFVLSVPGVEPSKIQAELPELPGDVRFVSSKKEFDGNGGTTINLY